MALMSLSVDFAALALSGTGITTAYQAGGSIAASRANRIRVLAVAVTLAASNSTSAQFKLQGSLDNVTWFDIGTVDDTVATPTVAVDQSKNTGSTATTPFSFSASGGWPFVRVAGKNSGGAGKAGETSSATIHLS